MHRLWEATEKPARLAPLERKGDRVGETFHGTPADQ